MRESNKLKKRAYLKSFLTSLLITFLIMAMSELLLRHLKSKDKDSNLKDLYSTSSITAQEIQVKIEEASSILKALEKIIINNNYSSENFRQWGQIVLDSMNSIASVQIAPNGIIGDVLPYDDHKDVIGLNLLNFSSDKSIVADDIINKRTSFIGPKKIIQNNKNSIIIRRPIYYKETNKFWGFVTAIIYTESFLEKELFKLKNSKTPYKLVNVINENTSTDKELVIFSSECVLDTWDFSWKISTPNGNWKLYTGLTERCSGEEQTVVRIILFIFTICIGVSYYFSKIGAYKRYSEIVYLNKKLTETNESKDLFLALVSHDLKGPFNSILNFSKLLKRALDSKDYERADRYSHHISESSIEYYNFLDRLLKWAVSQSQGMNYQIERNSISDVISSSISILNNFANEKRINIKYNKTEDIFGLFDYESIEFVIRNIISNAIKYTKTGGEVIVRVETDNEELSISIEDNGVGMAGKVVNNIFSIKNRSSKIGTNNEIGTGLGLIISNNFIKANNGKIEVSSTLNLGTKFTCYIPRYKND